LFERYYGHQSAFLRYIFELGRGRRSDFDILHAQSGVHTNLARLNSVLTWRQRQFGYREHAVPETVPSSNECLNASVTQCVSVCVLL